MSPNPEAFVRHLQAQGYHSRSNKHSNALAESIVDDLRAFCPRVREKASLGQIVYDLNFKLAAGTADWNVDLVLGAPPLGGVLKRTGKPFERQRPSTVEIAIEIKSVMTEHRKAVKNRKRDLEAHHEHVHNYNQMAIAGGVLVINAGGTFRSALRAQSTTHKDPKRLVEHCISELRSVAVRGGRTGYGLEASCAIVVDLNSVTPEASRYVTDAPAPLVGDPLYYDAFIQSICSHYSARF